jgi:hypothetical protein
LTKTIEQVEDGQDRVVKKHAGARITHDGADFFPPVRLIAVDGAFCTSWFGEAVKTMINTLVGIFSQ